MVSVDQLGGEEGGRSGDGLGRGDGAAGRREVLLVPGLIGIRGRATRDVAMGEMGCAGKAGWEFALLEVGSVYRKGRAGEGGPGRATGSPVEVEMNEGMMLPRGMLTGRCRLKEGECSAR